MSNLLQLLIPREKKFFTLFEKASGNLVAISQKLVEVVSTSALEKRKELIKEVERLEHAGDNITHETFNELSSTFITPFDREDIHDLTSSLDDIVDFIHGSAKRIELYKVTEIHPSIIKLAELIEKASIEIHAAIVELKNLKNISKVKESCVRINSIENHADDIFDMAIAQLFEEEKDAIKIIKTKEIFSALETATDKCEDVANVLETIILKSA